MLFCVYFTLDWFFSPVCVSLCDFLREAFEIFMSVVWHRVSVSLPVTAFREQRGHGQKAQIRTKTWQLCFLQSRNVNLRFLNPFPHKHHNLQCLSHLWELIEAVEKSFSPESLNLSFKLPIRQLNIQGRRYKARNSTQQRLKLPATLTSFLLCRWSSFNYALGQLSGCQTAHRKAISKDNGSAEHCSPPS